MHNRVLSLLTRRLAALSLNTSRQVTHISFLRTFRATGLPPRQSSSYRNPTLVRWNATKSGPDVTTAGTSSHNEEGVYSAEELVVGKAMLQRIVRELRENGGGEFVIPWHDDEIVAQICDPLRQMITAGVKPGFVISACVAEPGLFALLARRGAVASRVMAVLVDACRKPYEDILKFMAIYGEELVNQGDEAVQMRLDRLSAAGVDSPIVLWKILHSCPALLFAVDDVSLGAACEALGSFFSRKEITAIVQKCPTVLLQNVNEIEEKYEYIFFQMCMEGADFVECEQWGVMPLEDIMARHDFLLKCGRYTTPDKKNPQLKMENPSLHEILDSTEEHFACDMAGVTTEEWTLYKALREKLRDGEPAFERVKPSKRKAYERRLKELKELPDHVFDSSREL